MKKSSAIVLVLFAVAFMFTHTQATEKSEQAGATVTSVADGTELAPRECNLCDGTGNGRFCFFCKGSGLGPDGGHSCGAWPGRGVH